MTGSEVRQDLARAARRAIVRAASTPPTVVPREVAAADEAWSDWMDGWTDEPRTVSSIGAKSSRVVQAQDS